MLGLELPILAQIELRMAAKTAILSSIIVFGISKTLSNYFMGRLANRYARRSLLVAE